MPAADPLDGAGPGQATEVRCLHCDGRVLLTHVDRNEARKKMLLHLVNKHDLGPVLLEGTDFLCGPAPYRCDLCWDISEPPWWTYLTPNMPVQDPGWLVCEACHGLITTRTKPLAALVERSFEVQWAGTILDGVPPEKVRYQLKQTMRSFLAHVEGEPVRSTSHKKPY